MQPVLLEVGNFKLYSFGSFIALGALIGGLILYRTVKLRKLKTTYLFDVILYTLLIGILGARLSYYFTYQEQFKNFWQVFYFWQGGLLALGGLSVGFLAFVQFIRKHKQPLWPLLDSMILALLAGWGIGKIGCHLSTCTVGRATDSLIAIEGSFPIDLISAVWAALVFAALLAMWLRNRFSDGVIFFLGIEAFLLGELLIKTLKADFGEGIVRAEAMIYLGLIALSYVLFWRLHGPKIQKNRWKNWVGGVALRLRVKR